MSVTAVPLRPIKKGVLRTLWIGVGLAVATAAGAAWYGTQSPALLNAATPEQFLAWNAKQDGVVTTASGLQYKVLTAGTGGSPTDSDAVLVGYKGTLRDGTVFDENPQASFPVAGVVPGFSEALKLMKRGGKYRLWIPPALGYGDHAQGDAIPANSLLVFEVDLIDYKSIAEIQAEMDRVTAAREAAQPIKERTGGSTFKNPEGGKAWKLIDAAGCRGLRVGGAQVSEMHCNFLINTGGATAADVEGLGEEVRRRVKESSGFELQWEIKRLGVAA